MALRAVTDHPKFARLKRVLGLSKCHALGCLETMWHFAGKYTPHGNIGKYSDEEIESWLEWDGEPGALVKALTTCGWLDECAENRLVIHHWSQHADDATKLAVKRSGRAFVATVSRQCSDTVPKKPTRTRLPEPVPVPEPVPEPVPTHTPEKTSAPAPAPAQGTSGSVAEPPSPESAPEGVRVVQPRRGRFSNPDEASLVDLVLLGSPPGIVAGLTSGMITPAHRALVIAAAKREVDEHGISDGEALDGLRLAVESQACATPRDRLNLLGGFGKYFTESKYRMDPIHTQHRNGGHNGESKHMASLRQAAANLGLGPTGARQDEPTPRRQRLS